MLKWNAKSTKKRSAFCALLCFWEKLYKKGGEKCQGQGSLTNKGCILSIHERLKSLVLGSVSIGLRIRSRSRRGRALIYRCKCCHSGAKNVGRDFLGVRSRQVTRDCPILRWSTLSMYAILRYNRVSKVIRIRRRLVKAAKEFGDVTVVAPDRQYSVMSHRITIEVKEISDFPVSGVWAYQVGGTPAVVFSKVYDDDYSLVDDRLCDILRRVCCQGEDLEREFFGGQ